MATPAVGNGPLEFTDAEGRQVSIPLSALSFDSSGKLVAMPPYNDITKFPLVSTLLAYASAQRLIVPAVVPAPKPAMVIKAVGPLSAGNIIQIDIVVHPADNLDPTQATFDVTVTETDIYPGLSVDSASPAFIKAVLGTGTEKDPGTRPGLVHVTSTDPHSLPKEGHYDLTDGGTNTKSSKAVDGDPSGTAFTVEAKTVGADGEHTTVTISHVDSTKKTFTLAATWAKPKSTGLTILNVQQQIQTNLSYEITVSPPPGGVFSVPAAGTIQLKEGTNSAIIFASA